jgi:transposase
MIERNGKVIVEVAPNVRADTLRKLVKERVKKGSRVYIDRFKRYNSLIINGYNHIKIDKDKVNAFGKAHINSIESFWAYVKERLAKYRGIKPDKLYLYLKKLEFRFNNRENKSIEDTILTYLLNLQSYYG